ncbi:LysR family transcriptional regulator [Parasporobacterium paucivorans]|uniref:DNA-binding transcriptional regulator, LysR family n=1 Tax=Parasporobacterium paucivorans DSM 15970 TaxID=1122934 RepID=A0A1M6DJL9_9FIRM|nr:LysR family transcriptional regulator [Parasporobacterium paucivorans]SHI73537.1 DNA-binding transcriptional regulator, LysR family [Parasporobacterium paucivorans DSM 15970]
MTSKQIEYFLTVADCLNFTQAGKLLFASQPTISRQISLLEEELGFELFDRSNNQVRLTPAGLIMHPAFRNMRRVYLEQLKIARATSLGKNGSLSIGLLKDMKLDLFLTPHLEAFKRAYPNIELLYNCYPTGDYSQGFEKNDIDLAIFYAFDLPDASLFDFVKIHSTNIQVMFSSNHPLSSKKDLSFRDFQNETYITTNSAIGDPLKQMLSDITDHYEIPDFRIATYKYFESVQLNVRLSNGFAFVDPLIFTPSENDGFEILPLDKEVSSLDIYAVWKKDNLNPAAPLLTEFFNNLYNE